MDFRIRVCKLHTNTYTLNMNNTDQLQDESNVKNQELPQGSAKLWPDSGERGANRSAAASAVNRRGAPSMPARNHINT